MHKSIPPATIVTGLIIGSLVKSHITQPTYLSIRFEDNHYEATESAAIALPHVATEVKAYDGSSSSTNLPSKQDSNSTIEKLLNYIHKAESTEGKNKTPGALHLYCRAKGEWNELGYGGMALKICFKDEAEGRAKVGNWLKRHLEEFKNDEAMTLCYYNLGEKQVNCKYYQNYMGVQL